MIPADPGKGQKLHLTIRQKCDLKVTEQRIRQFLSKETEKMSTQGDWALDRADGYVEGERHFRCGFVPPAHLNFGLDAYARSFRAGYYSHVELLNQAGLAGFTNQTG